MLQPLKLNLTLLVFAALCSSACQTTPAYERTLVDDLAENGIVATQTERGVTVFLPDVLFEFDSDELSGPGRLTVDEVAAVIHRVAPTRALAVEGHADSIGPEEYNLDLSIRRAHTVAGILGGVGIDGQQITVLGLGETQPAASNEASDGRRRNRRVEIVVIRADVAAAPPPVEPSSPENAPAD
jgi:outer membrane protein OmpA-like peptidoglycan-associated protein